MAPLGMGGAVRKVLGHAMKWTSSSTRMWCRVCRVRIFWACAPTSTKAQLGLVLMTLTFAVNTYAALQAPNGGRTTMPSAHATCRSSHWPLVPDFSESVLDTIHMCLSDAVQLCKGCLRARTCLQVVCCREQSGTGQVDARVLVQLPPQSQILHTSWLLSCRNIF